MELDHEFTVPVPVDQAWRVLLDVERIAPCMPGATLDEADTDEFTGRLKVRLGAMTVTYRGTARIASRDEETRTVVIEASGKEARGPGTASATVQAHLHEDDGRTRVTVHTKLNVTGRPAQFGRGILAEVGGKLIGRFADNLAAELASEPAAPEGTGTPPESGPTEPQDVRAAETATGAPAEARAEAKTAGAPAESGAGTPVEPGTEASAEVGGEKKTAGVPAETDIESARAATTPVRREAEPIDLLEVAGPAVIKRAAPVAAAVAVLLVLWRLIRRRR
ncbi:SRPBCC domain-containing protein [Actinoallomurus sp. NPDC052274]|uniref:SRPBCC domain-containing protein n=1 Tax=Actinoallomurus sp. NPDC052274 TaxID=3155420 RepID=UPI003421BFFB